MRSITMQGIYKEARSIDAQRKKQYWQMLKRLHGGNDEAIAALKESGDDGIWHGTRKDLISKIEQEGLKVGPFREFGKGTFFGDKKTAGYYAEQKIVDAEDGIQIGGISVEEALKQPNKYRVSEGDLIRLAKPSELQGSKLKYPSVQGLKVFDVSDEKTLNHVAPSQTAYMHNKDDGIQKLMNMQQERINKLSIDEKRREIERIVRHEIESTDLYKGRSVDEINEMVRDNTEHLLEVLETGDQKKIFRATQIYKRHIGEDLAKTLYTPRNEQELNQLKYYGKLRGRRVFDRLGVNHRAEMFYDGQGIPPEFLRHADGTPMSNGQKEQLHISIPVALNIQQSDQSHSYIPSAVERASQLGTTLGLGAILGEQLNKEAAVNLQNIFDNMWADKLTELNNGQIKTHFNYEERLKRLKERRNPGEKMVH